jgi:hypothetical protein
MPSQVRVAKTIERKPGFRGLGRRRNGKEKVESRERRAEGGN